MKSLFYLVFAAFAGTYSLFAQSEAPKFPSLEAKSLNKEKITFPDDLEGEANILILVFKQEAQLLVDTWAKMILSEYEPQSNITYYEVPMISTWYVPISWQIDNWMRAGIPESFHDNTTTFYGNRQPYFKELGMDNIDSCYLFIVDQSGLIRFRAEGPMNEEKELIFRVLLNQFYKPTKMNKLLAGFTLASTILMFIAAALMIAFFGFNVTSNLEGPSVPIYLEPAGYAFIIWFFIYVGYILLGIYQFGEERIDDERYIQARPFIMVNSLANILWFAGVLTNQLWWTLICMLVLLYTLIRIAISLELGKSGATTQEKLFVKLPIGLYFGWITAATPINFTTFLIVDLGLTGQNVLNPELWSLIILGVALGIYLWMFSTKQANAIYLFVGIWAFVAIYIANQGISMLVGMAALISSIAMLLVFIVLRVRDDSSVVIL